jgi:hypothetical protein
MWQTKYASVVPTILGVGVYFRPINEGDFPLWVTIVRGYKEILPVQY